MKRDFDLIRELLIEVEGEDEVDLSSYNEKQINYHKALLLEAGLVVGPPPHYSSRGGKDSDAIPDKVYIMRLTWDGHEFLDKARNDSAWNRAKKLIIDRGLSLSFEALKLSLNLVIKNIIDNL